MTSRKVAHRQNKRQNKISVVVPVYNEEKIIEELILRLYKVIKKQPEPIELIIVDDASCDNSRLLLTRLQKKMILGTIKQEVALPSITKKTFFFTILSLPHNVGQFQATVAGIQKASAQTIITLDGDLQDPPELIEKFLKIYRDKNLNLKETIVFAVKQNYHGSLLYNIANFIYRHVTKLLAKNFPHGAGSFCMFDKSFATKLFSVKKHHANIVAYMAIQCKNTEFIGYEKQKRYDQKSRIGIMGLVKEALSTFQTLLLKR